MALVDDGSVEQRVVRRVVVRGLGPGNGLFAEAVAACADFCASFKPTPLTLRAVVLLWQQQDEERPRAIDGHFRTGKHF